jgi:class 3 adenylate cyclase
MMTQIDFQFRRSRGIVWVCDIVSSSSYLNDNETADDLEEFLPRFHWFSNAIVTAAGGRFIKWVGDGFLAWFETELHRHIPEKSYAVIQAAYHLTNILNVTQLDIAPKKKFRVRHGMTFEHDAHLTKILHEDGHEDLDITGRAVVLAFRLATVNAHHPNIVAEKQIVEGFRGKGPIRITFRKWAVKSDDRLKHFKGQRWGTKSIYRSSETTSKSLSLKSLVSRVKRFIRIAEEPPDDSNFPPSEFTKKLVQSMFSGPQWAVQSICDFAVFVGGMIEPLKEFVELVESLETARKEEERSSS